MAKAKFTFPLKYWRKSVLVLGKKKPKTLQELKNVFKFDEQKKMNEALSAYNTVAKRATALADEQIDWYSRNPDPKLRYTGPHGTSAQRLARVRWMKAEKKWKTKYFRPKTAREGKEFLRLSAARGLLEKEYKAYGQLLEMAGRSAAKRIAESARQKQISIIRDMNLARARALKYLYRSFNVPGPGTFAAFTTSIMTTGTLKHPRKILTKSGFLRSSNIRDASYDPPRRLMVVRFMSGAIYEYYNIPQALFKDIIMGNEAARTMDSKRPPRYWPGKFPSMGAALHWKVKVKGYLYRRIA